MRATVTFFGSVSSDVAEVMLDSAKKLNCEIVQLTDARTPALKGVDSVKRLPYNGDFGEFRLKHFMKMDGDVLHLDYDLIINRDISHLFDGDFDIGLTNRDHDKTVSDTIRTISPHNMGVIFSKGVKFWEQVYEAYKNVQDLKDWMLIQAVASHVFKRTKLKTKEFDGNIYNYTPVNEHENTDDKAVVHYKGPRKAWMMRRAMGELRKSA